MHSLHKYNQYARNSTHSNELKYDTVTFHAMLCNAMPIEYSKFVNYVKSFIHSASHFSSSHTVQITCQLCVHTLCDSRRVPVIYGECAERRASLGV